VQLTRYSRALKIWVSINYFGTRAIAAEIQNAMARARLLESLVQASPDFEPLCPAQFGIFCFRARPTGMTDSSLDDLNERINARVVAGGRFLISSTRLDGKFSLRMCTLGFRTTNDDIRELFDTIVGALEVEREAR
jgi:glutamate/tyrosine decarboxylase-like PLP-dependent enzyme